ncbi:MAG: hypothetical protein ABWW65_02660 [Thermoprotei archaeon]
MVQLDTFETIIEMLQPTLITIFAVLLFRFILGRILYSLAERGTITIAIRATIIKAIDVVVFFIIVVSVLRLIATPYEVAIAVTLIAVFGFFIFYYELREFLAYVNLQLLRHLRGKTFEIYFPHHSRPVFGRIVNIELLNTTIEDVYGKKVYVSNSLLLNAVLKDYLPSITLRIRLEGFNESPSVVLENAIKAIKELESKIFRIDERRVSIESMGLNKIVFRLTLYPPTTPVRISDLVDFIRKINETLNKYNPIIEIIEPV